MHDKIVTINLQKWLETAKVTSCISFGRLCTNVCNFTHKLSQIMRFQECCWTHTVIRWLFIMLTI